MRPSKSFFCSCLGAWLLLAAPAHATVLIFENSSGGALTFAIPQNYGDQVATTNEFGFHYGGAGGPTTNIVLQYLGIGGWPGGYGDLINVGYVNSNKPVEIRFATIEPRYHVLLHGFDMAGFLNTDYTNKSVQILNEHGDLLYQQTNVLIRGAGPSHTTFTFSPPIRSQGLRIRIDATNLGTQSSNIGIDNIHFSELLASDSFLEMGLYPGVTLYGEIGQTYQIDYTDFLGEGTVWLPLTSVVLTNSPQIYIDIDGAGKPRRFYQVRPPAPPGTSPPY